MFLQVSVILLGGGWYPSMPCRWYPSMPCRSPRGVYSRISRPTPRGKLEGFGWGVSRPTLRGKLRGLAWGSPGPHPGGRLRVSGQGVLQAHTLGGGLQAHTWSSSWTDSALGTTIGDEDGIQAYTWGGSPGPQLGGLQAHSWRGSPEPHPHWGRTPLPPPHTHRWRLLLRAVRILMECIFVQHMHVTTITRYSFLQFITSSWTEANRESCIRISPQEIYVLSSAN